MRVKDIRHKKTKEAVEKYGITPEMLETFDTLDDLKKYFLFQINKKWRDNNRSYWSTKYIEDPIYREGIKKRALEHFRSKNPDTRIGIRGRKPKISPSPENTETKPLST